MIETFMLKYGEIALKGNNKRYFEQKLERNIKRRIEQLGEFSFERAQSTIYVTPENLAPQTADGLYDVYDEIERRLLTVYGIGAIQRSLVLPKDYDEIVRLGVPYLKKNPHFMRARTFKIEAKRADKRFAMNSPELMREFGSAVWEANRDRNLEVDLHNPNVTIYLEIRDKGAYICANRRKGAGGIPVGASGKALVLLSGGIDSPVAAAMMAKRGLSIDMLHFESPPYTSERARMKVESLCEKLSEYCGELRLFTVNITEAGEEIRNKTPEEYMTVLLRRLMMKIASRLCTERYYSAIVTGESVGQVASQTPCALKCTDNAASVPVYRPVIGMDKIEITAAARKIGTYETSTLPFEDCCTVFTPRHPKLRPLIEDCVKYEERLTHNDLQKYMDSLTVKQF